MAKVVTIVRTDDVVLKRTRREIVEAGADPEKLAQLEALETLLKQRKSASYKEVTAHDLWPHREVLVRLWRRYPAQSQGRTRSSQLLLDLKKSGSFTSVENLDERQFGRWMSVVVQLVDEQLHNEVEGYIRMRAEQIREARKAARKGKTKYTYQPYAPGPVHRGPAVHYAPPQHDIAPTPAPARASSGGAGEVVSIHFAAPPALPTARESAAPAKKPADPATKKEGDLDYTGLSETEIAAVNAMQMPDARAAAVQKIREGHALRAQISADKAAEAEREAAAKSAAKSRSLEDFIAMKLDDMTIHDRREALERLHERGMVSPTIYADYRDLHGHEDHYVAKIGQLIREARRKL